MANRRAFLDKRAGDDIDSFSLPLRWLYKLFIGCAYGVSDETAVDAVDAVDAVKKGSGTMAMPQ